MDPLDQDPLDLYGDSDSDSDLTDAHSMPDEFSVQSDELGPPSKVIEPRARPRCFLCYFKFETRDPIVVFNPKYLQLLETWTGEYVESKPYIWDLEKGYHSECVDLVAKSLPFGDSIHRTILDRTSHEVGYTKILPSVEADRIHRLKKMFAQEFIVIIGHSLPLEICENIGRYCLSAYATQLINDVWTNKDFTGPRDLAIRVNASRSIWAQRVEFEGRQYIKSFSTARKSESDTKLFEPIPGIRASVYYAVDYLGIREVAITQDDNSPSLIQGDDLKYVAIRQKDLPFSIKAKSDGLKLRDLAITKKKHEVADFLQRRWFVLPNDLDIYQVDPSPPWHPHAVSYHPIQAVDWNLPGCRGYSVLLERDCILDIIPNNTGGSSSRLVDASSQHKGVWVYIPVDRDERIAEL